MSTVTGSMTRSFWTMVMPRRPLCMRSIVCRPARKAPGREQDERHGRQDGEEGAEDAEPETDEAERDK